jgi:chemotaxis-related protein WspD
VVIFRIGAEWLALPTPAFQEVAERRVIHTLPHRRHGVVLGLVNIRGELLICVSLGRLLGLAESKTQSPKSNVQSSKSNAFVPRIGATLDFKPQTLDFRLSERLLVTNWEGNRLVFPVHEVLGIRRVQNDELREPPSPCSDVLKAAFRCPIPHRHEIKPQTEGARGLGLSPCHNQTVGLLNADVLFATVNRNLQATSQPQELLDARVKNAGGELQQGPAEAT